MDFAEKFEVLLLIFEFHPWFQLTHPFLFCLKKLQTDMPTKTMQHI